MNYFRICWIACLLWVGIQPLFSQTDAAKPTTYDFVETRDGGKLLGKIDSISRGNTLYFTTDSGTHLTVPWELVKKYGTQERRYTNQDLTPNTYTPKHTHFFLQSYLSALSGGVNEFNFGFGGYQLAGYRWNPIWVAGGVGFEAFHAEIPIYHAPLLLETGVEFSPKANLSPYVSMAASYAYTWGDKGDFPNARFKGGIGYMPALGLRFGRPAGHGWTLDLGWRYQKSSFEYRESADVQESIDYTYKRLFLRGGLRF